MASHRIFYQNDPVWSWQKLGDSDRSIGKSGCLLCCLAMAGNIKNPADPPRTPDMLNAHLKKADAFIGPNLNVEIASKAIGLDCRYSKTVKGHIASMQQAILDAFDSDNLILAHVDHDADSGGDEAADHFVLMVHKGGTGSIHCLDPAAGDVVISFNTLRSEGDITWKTKRKVYTVKSVRPISKLLT